MGLKTENYKLHGLRGATTAQQNTSEAIENAVKELIEILIDKNDLNPDQIVSITFSVTKDLNACFPAAIARRQKGWDNIALLDCQQMEVPCDLRYCIRILAHVWLPKHQDPQHPYLREASSLRPDRFIKG